MRPLTEFQAECVHNFQGVLEEWGLDKKGTNILRTSELEEMASRLSRLAAVAGKGTIVDFGEYKHFDCFRNAYAAEDLLYISWKEGELDFLSNRKGSCLLRCKPELMIVYSTPATPRHNCIYLRTSPCPAEEGACVDEEGVAQCTLLVADMPDGFATLDGDHCHFTTLTNSIPILLHPKGSAYGPHDAKRHVMKQLDKGALG